LQHYNWIFAALNIKYLTAWKMLGISYILFRQIDYIMQYEYNQEQSVRISFIDHFNYQLSFYTIVCGPIVRYKDFVTDFYTTRTTPDLPALLSKFNRILNGFIKIYLVSSMLDWLVHTGFDHLTSPIVSARILAWCIVIFGNIWYIYFNFSGFMDVVIPAASLAGFQLPENFNRPYLARDISDFWNRWHITLSAWIKDYIYTPVFRSTIGKNPRAASYLALFVTFFLAGLWHGSSLNFLVYGILLGASAALSQLYTTTLRSKLGRKKYLEFRQRRVVHGLEVSLTLLVSSTCIIFVGLDIIGRLF
jgi:D-alanyl-lipoteichoic acid acyltransferase DltB (MBOAT superfamily)